MSRTVVQSALLAAVLGLGGCGFADSRAPLPEFMRIKETEQPLPEPPPDMRKLVREQLDVVFVAASNPRDVQVALPHHQPRGRGWTACVRAQLTSATGGALGTQTYIVTVLDGRIIDRRRAETEDICGSEAYQPV